MTRDAGGHSPPVLLCQPGWRPLPYEGGLTGGIEQTQRIRVIPNHHRDRISHSARYSRHDLDGSSQLSNTVGTYSEGNLLVVYEINKQVLT